MNFEILMIDYIKTERDWQIQLEREKFTWIATDLITFTSNNKEFFHIYKREYMEWWDIDLNPKKLITYEQHINESLDYLKLIAPTKWQLSLLIKVDTDKKLAEFKWILSYTYDEVEEDSHEEMVIKLLGVNENDQNIGSDAVADGSSKV